MAGWKILCKLFNVVMMRRCWMTDLLTLRSVWKRDTCLPRSDIWSMPGICVHHLRDGTWQWNARECLLFIWLRCGLSSLLSACLAGRGRESGWSCNGPFLVSFAIISSAYLNQLNLLNPLYAKLSWHMTKHAEHTCVQPNYQCTSATFPCNDYPGFF